MFTVTSGRYCILNQLPVLRTYHFIPCLQPGLHQGDTGTCETRQSFFMFCFAHFASFRFISPHFASFRGSVALRITLLLQTVRAKCSETCKKKNIKKIASFSRYKWSPSGAQPYVGFVKGPYRAAKSRYKMLS